MTIQCRLSGGFGGKIKISTLKCGSLYCDSSKALEGLDVESNLLIISGEMNTFETTYLNS